MSGAAYQQGIDPEQQQYGQQPQYAQPQYGAQPQYAAQQPQYQTAQYGQQQQQQPMYPVVMHADPDHAQQGRRESEQGFHGVGMSHDGGGKNMYGDGGMNNGGGGENNLGEKLNYQSTAPGASKYNDIGFLIAFAIHLIVMFIIAGVYGPSMISDIKETKPIPTTNPGEYTATSDNMFIALLVVAAVIGVVFSIFWLWVMKRFSSQIIHISIIAVITLSILGVIASFATKQVIMGVYFIIITLIICVYYYFVRSRIPFATAILESSVTAIQENSGPIFVVYALSVVQIAWMALWAFIFVSVYHAANRVTYITTYDPAGNEIITAVPSDNSGGLKFLQFFCVLSLYWTAQVLKNIGHVTTAGVVASWWFIPSQMSPTMPSFIRATTTSIGSICFGSLLVALVSTVRAILRSARRNACAAIADCLLGMLERFMKWFNTYAFCCVAIYGVSFMDGAKRTADLFKAQLFTAVINDDLSGMVLFMGAFLGGTCAGIVGILWGSTQGAEAYIVMGILAFIVGYVVAILAMSVIESAVTTTFCCWAMDPATLLNNRPVEFGRIMDAGNGKYAAEGIQQYSGQPQQPQQV